MARNDVYLNINALSPADAVVTGQQDMTAATVPELVLGDTPTFNFYFTDNTNVWPSWAGNAAYTLTWALSDAVAGDFAPAATTGNATPITGGWSVILPLNSYDLVGLLNTKRVGQPYPVQNLWQQLRVTDPSGNEVTRAMFWTPVRYRAISDTQNTESASPTGGRFVTVNNVNALTTPTAAQFYAANPVPTSALGSAANGELLIGNGTGFTKATLTAGTGVSITNGSGSITISATDGDITLDDGTAAAPSLKFTSDTDTGLYRPAANTLGVAVGGAQIAYFDENGLTVPSAGVVAGGSFHGANGNANNPSYSFSGDQDTGFFRHQPNEIGIALGGTQTGTLTAALATLTSKLLVSSGATTTAATDLLVNPAVKASGNLLDLQVASSSKFSVSSAGNGTFGGNLTVSGTGKVGGGSNDVIKLEADTAGNGGYVQGRNAADTDYTPLILIGNGLTLKRRSGVNASANALAIDTSGNTTLSGNLTVSGGTATISKSSTTTGPVLQLENTNDAIDAGGTLGRLQFYSGDDSGGGNSVRAWIDSIQTTATPVGSALRFAVANGANAAGEVLRIAESGNLLLKSDGTDSANGRLQLAGHTTSAGGIGFGTDVSLYRYSTNGLKLANTGSTSALYLTNNGATTPAFGIQLTSATAYLFNEANGSIIFGTNNTTALTLDASQNATFAGTVIANKATTAFRIPTAETPASASATGTIGTITWDASYIYVCTAANTWKRVAIATW